MKLIYFLNFTMEVLLKLVNFTVTRIQFVFEMFLRWFKLFERTWIVCLAFGAFHRDFIVLEFTMTNFLSIIFTLYQLENMCKSTIDMKDIIPPILCHALFLA